MGCLDITEAPGHDLWGGGVSGLHQLWAPTRAGKVKVVHVANFIY